MSNSKMLIDASHPEETRVVVLKGNRVEEFDFESASKRQLRGNIYLAKVTRVEPSLQAAFVEYGGNRHGFLAFSEIHPDYYQIPFSDRQALLEEEARAHRDEEEEAREPRGESRARAPRREGSREGDANRVEGGRGEGGRGGRNERGARRSRRHRRRDVSASALERRDPAEESLSEAIGDEDVFEAAPTEAAGALAIATALAEDAPASDGIEVAPAATEAAEAFAPEEPAAALPDAEPAATDVTGGPRTQHPEIDVDAPSPAAATPMVVASAPVEGGDDVADEPAVADLVETKAVEVVAASVVVEPAVSQAGAVTEAVDMEATAEAVDAAPAEAAVPAVEAREGADEQAEDEHVEEEQVEQIGGDALSDVAPRPMRLRRHYKIQEVIKRRQILLIQVVKEERGNKGAALTTYLSLAGRYSVLMPNTAKGGGISRKITDGEDRKRLKAIASELDVPEGMGIILRTAGASRSPVEVRRDFEYLLRMWESVRELTLKSSAPTLVYEEGSLIKRSIRDLYSKDVEEIVVSGEAGFAEARDFMRMLMPGNANSVQAYRDPSPIFAKSGVEAQLDAMFSAHVTLKSGGYLVINQTEALVAIDVNSGRSTREHNIEDTALRTNLEAADEVARQLRLRDLAGLIVVDFIDMEEGRNNRSVERRLKDALKNDRARIQIGRISHFGLLEMSRQRIRTGVLEGSTVVCPHCAGAGTVRSTASIALHVLRLVEDALIRDAAFDLVVRSRTEVALYMLNQKRAKLIDIEQRFGVTITVAADPTLTGMVYHAIERGELATPAAAPALLQDRVRVDSVAPIFDEVEEVEAETVDEAEGEAPDAGVAAAGDQAAEGRRRRRRRRRGGRERDGGYEAAAAGDAEPIPAIGFSPEPVPDGDDVDREIADPAESIGIEATPSAPTVDSPDIDVSDAEPAAGDAPVAEAEARAEPSPAGEPALDEAPKRRRSRRAARTEDAEVEAAEDAAPRPRRRRASRAKTVEAPAATSEAAAIDGLEPPVGVHPAADVDVGADTAERHPPEAMDPPTAVPAESTVDTMGAVADAQAMTPVPDPSGDEPSDPSRPKRSGWWQRAKSSFGA